MSIIGTVNNNIGLINLVFSFVVAASTLVYSVLTWRLTKETRLMRRVQTEPKISIFVELDDRNIQCVSIVILNVGLGPAYDLRFDIEKENDKSEQLIAKMRKFGFINSGICFLPPQGRLKTLLTIACEKNDILDGEISVLVTYANAVKEKKQDKYLVNFDMFKGIAQAENSDSGRIEKAINSLRDSVEHIARASQR